MSQKSRRLRIVLLATAFAAGWSLATPAMAQRGDLNCDGAVNHFDVEPFVLALIDPAAYAVAYPNCNINRADMNADTLIDGLDTQPFVAALLGLPCPPGLTSCGGGCVDLNWDANNCGACGNTCQPLEHCSYGQCEGVCIGCG